MKRVIVLLLMAVLLLGSTGCTVVQETHAFAESFPDKYWENVWVIEERKTDMVLDGDLAVMNGYCQVLYLGEKPAEDVKIIIRSPLTYEFIGSEKAWEYGTVEPGTTLQYIMHAEFPDWKENVPVYIFGEKVEADYRKNFYVGISWRDGEHQYNKKFFNWHEEKH